MSTRPKKRHLSALNEQQVLDACRIPDKNQKADKNRSPSSSPTKKLKRLFSNMDIYELCGDCLDQLYDDGEVSLPCSDKFCLTFWKKRKFRHRPSTKEQGVWNFTNTERYQSLYQILIDYLSPSVIHNIGQLICWSEGFQCLTIPFYNLEMLNADEFTRAKADIEYNVNGCAITAMAINKKNNELLILGRDENNGEQGGILYTTSLTDLKWESVILDHSDILLDLTVDEQTGIVYIHGYNDIGSMIYQYQRISSTYSLINSTVSLMVGRLSRGSHGSLSREYNFIKNEFLLKNRPARIVRSTNSTISLGIEERVPLPSNCKLHFRKSDGCVAILYGLKLVLDSDLHMICTYRFVIIDPHNHNKIMESKEFSIRRRRKDMDPTKFFSKPVTDFAFDDRRVVVIDRYVIYVVGLKVENSVYVLNLKKSICHEVVICGDTIILSVVTQGAFCLVYNLSI
jgi:hypothetical protein